MGQYESRVERQRLLLEAEEWSKGFKSMHSHNLKSMWYDDRPEDTDNGQRVIDIQYNSGLIKRTCSDGSEVIFGEQLKGEALIDSYRKQAQWF